MVKLISTHILAILLLALSAFAEERDVVILYTNDFHSAIDPIPAYWLPGIRASGGAARSQPLVDRIRDARSEERPPRLPFRFAETCSPDALKLT